MTANGATWVGFGAGFALGAVTFVVLYKAARPRIIETARLRARNPGLVGRLPEPLRTTIQTTFAAQIEPINAELGNVIADALNAELP